MIPRYSRPEMTSIWSEDSKFQIWFEIEAHACDAQARLGVIPAEAAAAVWERGAFDIGRINEIERETKHDVIAFLTNLAEHVGEEARFVHQGMTSSDVLDTTLAVQMARASDLLLQGIDRLLAALKTRAEEHRYTPTIGRSHGIHAEPTTFGLKLASFYAEFVRCRRRLENARAEIATCAISGRALALAAARVCSARTASRLAASRSITSRPGATRPGATRPAASRPVAWPAFSVQTRPTTSARSPARNLPTGPMPFPSARWPAASASRPEHGFPDNGIRGDARGSKAMNALPSRTLAPLAP